MLAVWRQVSPFAPLHIHYGVTPRVYALIANLTQRPFEKTKARSSLISALVLVVVFLHEHVNNSLFVWIHGCIVYTNVAIPRCLHSGHGSGMKRAIIWPLLSPLSQFDMMNVQFPLSPHSQLITISINKVCPTSVVDIVDQRVTSSDDLSL